MEAQRLAQANARTDTSSAIIAKPADGLTATQRKGTARRPLTGEFPASKPATKLSGAYGPRRTEAEGEDLLAVSLATEIIMDVANAADPGEGPGARDRLSAPSQGPSSTNFAASLDAPSIGRPRAADPAGPFQQFESFCWQSFSNTMLPQEDESVYGDGLAGDMWKR